MGKIFVAFLVPLIGGTGSGKKPTHIYSKTKQSKSFIQAGLA